MTGELRDISVTLGSKTYALQTRLSSAEEERIKRMALDFFGPLADVQNQEEKLVLGWLLLAHRWIAAKERLEALVTSIADTTRED